MAYTVEPFTRHDHNGKELTASVKDGKVMIGGATVTQADIVASNGVIHVIDTVLLP